MKGWKDQHASQLSFAGDAYLNEMGITNRLQPTEITTLCDTVKDPEDTPGADGLADIDHFALRGNRIQISCRKTLHYFQAPCWQGTWQWESAPTARRAVKWKVLPCPTTLSSQRRPPNISANWRAIVSPRPVPP
jgi:hypothetical protein